MNEPGETTVVDFAVEGMTCEHCATTLTERLRRLKGVHATKVDLAAQRASLRVDGSFEVETAVQSAAARGFTLTPVLCAGVGAQAPRRA